MPRNVIADSSALVALVRQDDQDHRRPNAHMDALPRPWRTCEGTLSEAFHLVGRRGDPRIKEMPRRGAVVLTTDPDFKIYRRHSRQVVPGLLP